MASVDDRIVAMKFDNKSFEDNAATTLSTLDRLKKSLDFGKEKSGLADLSTASKNFSLEGMASAVDSISQKFSAMGAIGFSVLNQLTQTAMSAGGSLLKSLSLDPITAGYQEYATNINSIQTILANTSSKGTGLEDVNAALDQLNDYSDKTIYNFSQMAKNVGTFTAAGVDLDLAVQSIKGISNLAAISGSSAEQASNAMYQLSQAISSGSIRLIDWISVRNAGMGGEVFQKALFETGKALKTIEGLSPTTTFEEWTAAGNSFTQSLSGTGEAVLTEEEKVSKANQEAADIVAEAQARKAEATENAAQRVRDAEENVIDVAKDTSERIADAIKARDEAAIRSAENIASAEENQKNVFEQTAEAVKRATEDQQRSVEDGAKNVARAFENVVKARDRLEEALKPASTDQLQAAEDALLTSKLDQADAERAISEASEQQRRAREDLTKAQKNFNAVLNDPTKSQEEIRMAGRAADDAAKRVTDLGDALERAQLKQNAAGRAVTKTQEELLAVQNKGNEADQNVIDAKVGLEDAIKNLADIEKRTADDQAKAIKNLAQVQEDSEKQRTKAVQDVAQARADAAESEVKSNERVAQAVEDSAKRQRNAQESLEDSRRNNAKTIKQSAEDFAAAEAKAKEIRDSAVMLEIPSWLTSEVLTQTLAGFTGDLTKAQLLSMNYTEEQADEIIKLGKLGQDAATKVKTLTQLLSTVRETIGSGWSASFRTIFGDFEAARNIFTDWSDRIKGVADANSDARNSIINDWADLGGRISLIAAIEQVFTNIGAVLKPIKEAFRELFPKKTGADFAEITKKVLLFLRGLELGSEGADKLKRIFKGVFSIFKIGVEIISGVFGVFKKLFNLFVDTGGNALVNFFAKIGDGLFQLQDVLVGGGVISGFFDKLGNTIVDFATKVGGILGPVFAKIGEIFTAFKNGLMGIGENAGSGITKFFSQLGTLLSGGGSRLTEGFLKTIVDGFGKLVDILSGAWNSIKQFDFSKLLTPFIVLWDFLKAASGPIASAFVIMGSVIWDVAKIVGRAIADIGSAIGDFGSGTIDKIQNLFGGTADGLAKFDKTASAIKSSEGLKNFKSSLTGVSKSMESFKSSFGSGTGGASLKLLGFGENADSVSKIMGGVANRFSVVDDVLKPLGRKLGQLISELRLSDIFKLINAGLLFSILNTVRRFVSGFEDVMKSISRSINGVTDVLKAMALDIKAGALIKIAAAIGILALSLILLSTVDAVNLGKATVAMAALVYGLTGTMADLANIAKGSAAAKDLIALSFGMILVAGAVLVLSFAVKNLASLNPHEVTTGVGAVIVLLQGLKKVMKDFNIEDGQFVKMALSLYGVGVAVKKLSKVVIDLGKEDPLVLLQGLTAVGVLLAGLVKAFDALPKKDEGKIVGLVAFAFAIRLLAWSIRVLGEMDLATLLQGMGALAGIFGAITAMLNLIPNDVKLKSLGTAFLGIGVGLVAMGIALKILGSMDFGEMLMAIGSLAVLLPILVGAIILMNNFGGNGAAMLAVVAVGILLLAAALKSMAELSIGNIVASLLAIAGVLAIILIAGAIITASGDTLLLALLGLGAALALIGVGFGLMGIGAKAFAEAFEIISRVGDDGIDVLKKLLGMVVSFVPEFIKNLISGFADGLIQLLDTIVEMAPKLIDGLVKIFIQMLQGIRKVLPELGKTIGEFIDTVLKLLTEKGPDIITAGIQFLINLLKGIAQKIGDITNVVIDIITGFLDALADRADDLVDGGTKVLVEFLKGLTENVDLIIGAAVTLIATIIKEMAKAITDLTEEIKGLIIAIGDAIVGVTTTIADQAVRIISALILAMAKAIGEITADIKTLIVAIGSAIVGVTQTIADQAVRVISAFIRAMADGISEIAQDIKYLLEAIGGAIIGVTDTMKEQGIAVLSAIVQAMIDGMTSVTDLIIKLVEAVFDNILKAEDAITTGAGDFLLAFLNALTDAVDKYSDDIAFAGGRLAAAIVAAVVSSPVQGIMGFFSRMFDWIPGVGGSGSARTLGELIAEDVANGIASGVGSQTNTNTVVRAGSSMANKFKDSAKAALGINSPSKEFMKMAASAGEGLLKGAKKDSMSGTAGETLANRISSTFKNNLSMTALMTGVDIGDINPTITPVLDLTNVERNAARLGSLLTTADVGATVSLSQANALSAATNAQAVSQDPTQQVTKEVKFEQNIYAPEQLSTADIYRQTKSQIALAEEKFAA